MPFTYYRSSGLSKPMAFRVLFSSAASYNLDVDQMDVKTAFVYGLIGQLIYVEDQNTERNDCKQLKALYGLKQSSRLWYEYLFNLPLKKPGLKHINTEYSIFNTLQGLNGPIVSTFIDDIKIMGFR